jgi:hypothetical protein
VLIAGDPFMESARLDERSRETAAERHRHRRCEDQYRA